MPRPRRPWFRFYVEAIWDRKLRRLNTDQRWLLTVCWALARDSHVSGSLMLNEGDPMEAEDIADAAAMPLSAVTKGLDALLKGGLLERDKSTEILFVPRWKDRQYETDSSAERMTKHRHNDEDSDGLVTPLDRHNGNGSDDVVTPPENRVQSTETEKEKPSRRKRRATALPKDWKPSDHLKAWLRDSYPNVNGKLETEKFRNHAEANGRTLKDWSAAWRNWIINAATRYAPPGQEQQAPLDLCAHKVPRKSCLECRRERRAKGGSS